MTLRFRSGPQVFDRGNTGYGYIVVNRRDPSAWPQGDDRQAPAPALDWNAPAETSNHGADHTGGDWWGSLFDEPLVSLDDLARQSGLKVKKPH